MKINLKIDYLGDPYIELLSERDNNIEDQLLEVFIRKAKERGIILINKTDTSARNDYVSIQIR